MRVLFDTHVVLDFLLDRRPFSAVAARLVARVERGEIEGLLGATTLTTVHYLLTKAIGRRRALDAVRTLLTLFAVAAVGDRVLTSALELAFEDYEDAVLHEAARQAGARVIVTRKGDDFASAELTVDSPEELEALLAASSV